MRSLVVYLSEAIVGVALVLITAGFLELRSEQTLQDSQQSVFCENLEEDARFPALESAHHGESRYGIDRDTLATFLSELPPTTHRTRLSTANGGIRTGGGEMDSVVAWLLDHNMPGVAVLAAIFAWWARSKPRFRLGLSAHLDVGGDPVKPATQEPPVAKPRLPKTTKSQKRKKPPP